MKILKILLSLLLVVIIFSGCSARDELPSATQIAIDLKAYSADTVIWAELDKTKISSYFGFTDENISEFSGFVNDSEELFDIVAVFKLKDPSAKQEVLSGINFIVENTDNTFRIANKSVSDKIANKIVAETDDLIILCIMDNYSQISKYLTDVLDAKIIS